MRINFKRIGGSLILRSFYLISIPIVLIQLIGIIIFFELHWDLVLKKLSKNIVNNIEIFVDKYDHFSEISLQELNTLEIILIKNDKEEGFTSTNNFFLEKRMKQALGSIKYKSEFGIYNNDFFIFKIYKNKNLFKFLVAKDKLHSKTITGFFLWILFCSIILSLISYLFIKNQIRPLKRLGIISRSFGRGIETPNIRPTGSSEIRGLIRDFNNMKNNIIETITSQKTMLAGISHDLRTPLTRIMLIMDSIEDQNLKKEINSNINEMNSMIEHYIDFIKNEKNEPSVELQSDEFILDCLKKFPEVNVIKNDSSLIQIKKIQISRSIHNIIDNAQKFAQNIYIQSYFINKDWLIIVDDDGPGTELSSEELIKPFIKGKKNLNQGSGLGLSILKKIIDLNNGKILFEKSEYGGLKVTIRFNKYLK